MATLGIVSNPLMKNRLTDMVLDFVSLVPAGDDPMAQVVISKAASGPDPKEHDMGDAISKDDLDPEVVEYIEGLEGEVTDLTKTADEKDATIVALTAERDEAVAKSATVSKSAEDQRSELLEKADPALRAFIEKQEKDMAEATSIAKAERDARLDREYLSKAESMPMVAEDKSSFGSLLRRMADALDPKDMAEVEKHFVAANTQITKGNLFTEFGMGGAETTISKSVTSAAQELIKADPTLTMEQAQAKVYETNPDLLAQAMTNQEG